MTETLAVSQNNTVKPALSLEETHLKPGWIDLLGQRWIYLGLSLLFLLPGLFFMVKNVQETPYHAPVKLGIDFVGGTLLEYGSSKALNQSAVLTLRNVLEAKGYTGSFVQLRKAKLAPQQQAATPATEGAKTEPSKEKALTEPGVKSILSVRTKPLTEGQQEAVQQALSKAVGEPLTVLQTYAIGPTLAGELLKNAVLALGLSYLLIFGYVTYRFQWDYAISAMLALLHDSLFVFGLFATLGYFFGTEVDSLFITALLTVVGFSVHDTIVVFDRLRENSRLLHTKKLPFAHIANISIQQTLARSINTSLTCMLALLALYLFGGTSIKDFVLTMLVGIGVGTFSSIFIATLILVWMREGKAAQKAYS
jgi:preprotein translocase subunit SecF